MRLIHACAHKRRTNATRNRPHRAIRLASESNGRPTIRRRRGTYAGATPSRGASRTPCDAFTPPDALHDGINRSLFELLPGPVQDALHMRLYYAIAIAAYQRTLRPGGRHGR